jgi:hypothetical protein
MNSHAKRCRKCRRLILSENGCDHRTCVWRAECCWACGVSYTRIRRLGNVAMRKLVTITERRLYSFSFNIIAFNCNIANISLKRIRRSVLWTSRRCDELDKALTISTFNPHCIGSIVFILEFSPGRATPRTTQN